MVINSENLLCYAVCDTHTHTHTYIYIYIKNVRGGVNAFAFVYILFSMHTIEKFTWIQPILKSNST